MHPAVGTRAERPVAQNIDTILRLEKQDEAKLAVHHRLFHSVGWFVGTVRFIVLQCVFVLSWVVLNHVFPHHAFDEYPFPLLATILALEAVLLTSCVLIRQSRIALRNFWRVSSHALSVVGGGDQRACSHPAAHGNARHEGRATGLV